MAGESFIPGCVIVTFVMGTQDEEIQDLLSKHGLTVINHLEHIGHFVLGVPEGREQEYVDTLTQEPIVEHAFLNGAWND